MLKYEDLIAELRQRPLAERLSLLEILAQSIKQEVSLEPASPSKAGAKFVKINDFDPNWRPSPEEIAQNQAWLAESENLAEKSAKADLKTSVSFRGNEESPRRWRKSLSWLEANRVEPGHVFVL